MAAVRWALLLAAVHRQPGGVILAVVAAGVAAEYARRRWSPWRAV